MVTDASGQPLAAVASTALPCQLLRAWLTELQGSDSPDARAHWWRESHWLPRGEVPGALLRATVAHVDAALPAAVAAAAGRCSGLEFWTQRRPTGSSMQLHWDCDEEHAQRHGELRSPLLSVVLYLDDHGGPTLVLDQRPPEALGRMVRASLVWPHAGAMAVFEGSLLHGVCGLGGAPTAAPQGVAASGRCHLRSSLRHTLLFNYWRERPLEMPPLPEVLVPHIVPPCEAPIREEVPRRAEPRRVFADGGAVRRTLWTRCGADGGALVADGGEGCGTSERRELVLGMFDRHVSLAMELPPIEYRGQQLDEFETVVSVRESDATEQGPHTAVSAIGTARHAPVFDSSIGPRRLDHAPRVLGIGSPARSGEREQERREYSHSRAGAWRLVL
ncbi:hypothetical protein EMIHUDRAFT_103706 [Emiliania huxleyi CCMP1516]|uniref:Prolyl 4-hydroxylase alpha subunit Fe(2+) 2OG dioxygenase domain-containing protein n=2 Tax=Emiliania huxleyi TaxID=2903 RepID=A0A0D3IRH7_EMIH1|nr:hypothetical protein EMIHUDRAFT_103706 [Emiliania huxleyi CCMP1516]EOD13862.1 hypothetical protein EMIHUDRAFT_103706 [Emiliania huxleyi CCMP1516]|eukprot:XP_005766291.1 hypothetical protein EMIHUDRAFT_103706 [Emiliania huxleyi CCMP1516]